jgi:hypothetical protein
MADEIEKKGWKKRISDLLKELGFIDSDFKGKVIIDINQGGTRSLDKNETFE